MRSAPASLSSDDQFVRDLFAALRATGLEAIVVGTGGAALLGAPILTVDIDLLIRDTQRNRQKLRSLCSLTGASPVEVSPLTASLRLVGLEINVDLMFDQLPGGPRFESLRSRAVRVPVGDQVALVASLADIVEAKEKANRPKDRAQLPILRDTLRVQQALQATGALRPVRRRAPRKRGRDR